MESNRFMSCRLKVDTQSAGTIAKILSTIEGVSYRIDVERGVANVSGNIDLKTLLKMLSKTGKHAELLTLESAAASSGYYPAPPPPDHAISPTHSLFLRHHPYTSFHNPYDPDYYYHHIYDNYHPDMYPTAPDHCPVLYQPPPAVEVHGYPPPTSPAKVRPRSTCSIM